MKIFAYLIIIFLFITNCSLNKVVKKHGIRNLEIKQEKLNINQTNINDITQLLGPPSTKSTFDNDIWIFIEREITHEKIFKLGKEKLITNNVLVLEIDNKGMLVKKDFYNINEMNDIKLSSLNTKNRYSKRSFVFDFLSSMRQKINDPLKKRKQVD
tara:strand:- start:8 stop:475 length:468 start_codon:yes stop_codon:yes gene_type:complete